MASINVNPQNLSFDWKGGKNTSTVTSSANWSLNFGGAGNEWCYATKSGNTITVETEWNLGSSTRGTGVNAATSVTAAAISVTQTSIPNSYIKYNVLSKVGRYAQLWGYDCASACLCMCIKQSPQSVYDKYPNEYFKPGYGATWGELTKKYGYNCTSVTDFTGTTADRLAVILNLLKSGNPVIVKVNNTDDEPHWVVVAGYAAPSSSTALSDGNFLCLDPYKLKTSTLAVPLNTAVRYTGVYKYVVVSK